MKSFALFVLINVVKIINGFVESDCFEDSTWVEDFVKFECFEVSEDVRGYEPTACVPSDEEDGEEYTINSEFDYGNFHYKCARVDDNTLRLEKLGCIITESGKNEILTVGENLNSTTGQYQCKRTEDDEDVELNFYEHKDASETFATTQKTEISGCVDESGQLHEIDSVWDVDNVQLICLKHGDHKTLIKPNACITEGKNYVHLHSAIKIDEFAYACVRDTEFVAHLIKLEVPECFDNAGNPRQVGEYWEDSKFRYRCLVHNKEAVTKVEGVILSHN